MKNNTNKTEKLIIIGAGMAGTRFAFNLAESTDNFSITLINAEPHAGYNRIMLSPVLAGEKTFEDITLYPEEDYQKNNITLKTNCNVSKIDTTEKQVFTSNNECLSYDKLVFATGSNPFILPMPNHNAQGVLAFRTMADVDAMLAIAQKKGSKCLVIGAGLLGLEAANALNNHGAQVSVVHIGEHILDRQLDATAASLLQQHFEKKGIKFLLQAFSDSIEVNGNNQVMGLTFKDGSAIPRVDADCIIMTVGVRPNMALAQESDVPCERGILVDSHMQTQVDDVFAIGECVQFEQNLFGLVAPVYEQAGILVKTLLGTPEHYTVKSTATKLKVSGVNLFSAGDVNITAQEGEAPIEKLIYQDDSNNIYKMLNLQGNKLVSAVMYGDVTDGSWFFELIQNKTDISAIRQDLLFGKAFCEDALEAS